MFVEVEVFARMWRFLITVELEGKIVVDGKVDNKDSVGDQWSSFTTTKTSSWIFWHRDGRFIMRRDVRWQMKGNKLGSGGKVSRRWDTAG